ncbi:MAG: putative Alpha,2-mannosidase [Ferruginibacter sp.]|nr:putative Alpha,2-mannosidase [Ferruginibacter sp.]
MPAKLKGKFFPIFIFCLSITVVSSLPAQKLTSFVDPFIGTGGHGHTYPGATVPFGMVQLSPDNGTSGWDWCSGYNYSDTVIAGFSHMHLSGTGIGDLADISVMPNIKPIPDSTKMFTTSFSHSNESARPGFYSVKLNNGIKASFTATERCGLHQYVFPAGTAPVIRFDLGFKINSDNAVETYIKQVNDSTIIGYRYSSGWAKVQRVYFAARTSSAFKTMQLSADGKDVSGQPEAKAKIVKCQLIFTDKKGKPILMKVALSSVATENALTALQEIPDWNFKKIAKIADDKWEAELQKIKIDTKDPQCRRIFYTALYHTNLAPVLYSDADGTYKNILGKTIKMKHGQRYTVFSLWDTFRALHPLLTITQPERYTDILNSLLAFYDENGALPVWDLNTWETNTMTGYHCIPVLTDAIFKNWPGIDIDKAYEGMKKSASQSIRGTPDYIKYGYLPQDKLSRSASITLEYGFDDWCIAQVAKKLGKMDDYKMFMNRGMSYQRLFDKETGFIRARNSDGKFVTPFDPYYSDHDGKKSNYVEGNAWQHSFFVPHDVRGLAKEYGSYQKFAGKLDSLFSVSSEVTGENASADISGLIGQYAHGNEPSHQIAYMYDYVGQPWKTQSIVRKIMDSLYHDLPDGYSGNEDCGQMSAWAVWSIVGLYPVNPANGEYVFGSPCIDNAVIALPKKKTFEISVKNNSKINKYIQRVSLDGKPYNKIFITHQMLMKGGKLEFLMGPNPDKTFGTQTASWPSSVNN